jgi:Cof subfamily protein (haloacid dehalogenase superfamily)
MTQTNLPPDPLLLEQSNSEQSSDAESTHPQIRALFLDIDGTLVDANDRISVGVHQAIAAAREKGVEVVLCTGRARYTAEPIARQLPPPLGYAVTSNGGVAIHLGTHEVLYRRLLSIPVALEVIRAIYEAGGKPYVYEDATSADLEGARVLYHPDRSPDVFALPPRYRPHAAILEDLPFAPVSVCTFGPPAQIKALVAHLRAGVIAADLSIIQSGSHAYWGVEVFTHGVSKRLGLEMVAARLDVDQEEIMAIGDHMNDLEMIQWAGIGVAMGNALAEVQEVADYVTGSLADDGVAQAIRRFIL